MPNEQVVQRLKEVKAKIPEIRSKEVEYRDSPEFDEWKEKVIKWLKLGGPHTSSELAQFKELTFESIGVAAFDEDEYFEEDQDQYEYDCDRAVAILKSAIENIRENLVPETAAEPKFRAKVGGSNFGEVNIAQAGTVVMGDKNIVTKIDSITVFDFLKMLENEIQEKVQDPRQKTTLLEKIKEFSKTPPLLLSSVKPWGKSFATMGNKVI